MVAFDLANMRWWKQDRLVMLNAGFLSMSTIFFTQLLMLNGFLLIRLDLLVPSQTAPWLLIIVSSQVQNSKTKLNCFIFLIRGRRWNTSEIRFMPTRRISIPSGGWDGPCIDNCFKWKWAYNFQNFSFRPFRTLRGLKVEGTKNRGSLSTAVYCVGP